MAFGGRDQDVAHSLAKLTHSAPLRLKTVDGPQVILFGEEPVVEIPIRRASQSFKVLLGASFDLRL
jgi:hypothetical protein